MSNHGFIGKTLYGIKDRLYNHSDKKGISTKLQKTQIPMIQEEKELIREPKMENEKRIEKISDMNTRNDKEYLKMLEKRKEEFARTKQHVIGKISEFLEENSRLSKKFENGMLEIKKVEEKLNVALEQTKNIDEKKWKDYDFVADLGDAMKKVENARLELIMHTNKLEIFKEEEKNATKPVASSIIPELTSLGLGQILRMGIYFFLPLIIGLIITGAIISFAIFLAMRVF